MLVIAVLAAGAGGDEAQCHDFPPADCGSSGAIFFADGVVVFLTMHSAVFADGVPMHELEHRIDGVTAFAVDRNGSGRTSLVVVPNRIFRLGEQPLCIVNLDERAVLCVGIVGRFKRGRLNSRLVRGDDQAAHGVVRLGDPRHISSGVHRVRRMDTGRIAMLSPLLGRLAQHIQVRDERNRCTHDYRINSVGQCKDKRFGSRVARTLVDRFTESVHGGVWQIEISKNAGTDGFLRENQTCIARHPVVVAPESRKARKFAKPSARGHLQKTSLFVPPTQATTRELKLARESENSSRDCGQQRWMTLSISGT